MNPELWAAVRPLFFAVAELPPAQRRSWLLEHGGNDEAVQRELQALLAAHDVAAADQRVPETRGDDAVRIGDYRLVRQLGEGGFGTVHLAEQLAPVRRTVALKVLRADRGGAAVVERFAREREVLARMSHPNIAQIFDAGTTASGQPFFAMECVEGLPLTRYCDEHRMSLPARLRLLALVCHGVHHAHQKGVIHRDLKPSNVLVVTIDGNPVPKIIDFGIAKATLAADAGSDGTVPTHEGPFLGTPGYMSPEQANLDGGALDVRSDVYSLGVLLYELATGHRPHEPKAGNLLGYLQRLREQAPVRPSTRVISQDTAVAAQRDTTVPNLRRHLRGDLDWIALRALEHAVERRYQSAGELADELERHLRHQPVRAGPPGPGYVLRKFVRRHRVVTASAATVALALVAGLVVALWQYGIARQALREAVGNRLSAQSLQLADASPTLALLLAVEGASRAPGEDADAALFGALRNHREMWRRSVHDGPPRWIARSADDRWQLSGDETRLVLCTDTATGEVRQRFDLHDADLVALAIDATGRQGASLDADGVLLQLDLATGATARRVLPAKAVAAAFVPDAALLVAGEDGVVRRVDAAGVRSLWTGAAPVRQLAVDARGERAAVMDTNQVLTVFAIADGKTLIERAPGLPVAAEPRSTPRLQFSGDGRWLVALDASGEVAVIDVATASVWQPTTRCVSFALAATAPRLALASWQHAPRIVDLETRSIVTTLATEYRENAMLQDFSADGTTLLLMQFRVPGIEVWDAETGQRRALLAGDPHAFYDPVVAGHGEYIDALGHSGVSYRWRLAVFEERTLLGRWQRQGRIRGWLTVPPGDTAVVVGGAGAATSINLVSTIDGAPRGRLAATGAADPQLALSPRGDALFVATPAGTALLRLPDGEPIAHFGHQLRAPRCSPSLAFVAGIVDGRAMVWSTADAAVRFDRAVKGIQRIDIAADGQHVVTADGVENTATVWSVERGAIVHTIAHRAFVFDACFTADGRELLSFANDASVLQVDVTSGRQLRQFRAATADFGWLHTDAAQRWFGYRTPEEVAVFNLADGACRWRWRPTINDERIAEMGFAPSGERLVVRRVDGRSWSIPLDPLTAAQRLAPRALAADELQRYRLQSGDAPPPVSTSVKQCIDQALAAVARADLAGAERQLAIAPTLRRRLPPRFHYARAAAASLEAAQVGAPLDAVDHDRAFADLLIWMANDAAAVRLAETTPVLAALRAEPGFAALLATARQALPRR